MTQNIPEGQNAEMSRPVQRTDWQGLLAGARSTRAEVALKAPLQQSTDGGSGTFLGLGADGVHYWIKPLNNFQSQKVPITEQIVGRIGRLINAPVCEVRTISITEDFSGWVFRRDRKLEPGIAHASRNVEDVTIKKGLHNRADDDNSRRHALMYGLYDWCWGGDLQGLLALTDDNRYYSHDHGHYLPPNGANWDASGLEANVDEPHELSVDTGGISPGAVDEMVRALTEISREQIANVLKHIPADWPVTDDELESVGFFLEKRSSAVAERLRDRFGRAS